ncbi:uncharacterized protein LOC133791446 [Humulus lupulus]|uniref:uncharacterized protein LOC133791446 n=1 Tax=Humulus lupulus TaxID=3486 RepID=UPI002B404EB5|nr:uncharacterized protein LOC133791446 [Humulus lupulus]
MFAQLLMDEEQPSLLIPDIPFSRIPPNRPHSNPSYMGRVKSAAQKKKPSKPYENQPISHAEIPSTSGRAESTPELGIQTQAQLRNVIRPDVEWYVAPPSRKKSHKRQSGEGYSNPSTKKSRTENPHAPTPTKETTPPPAPTRDATPPFPVNLDPPSSVGQTPPPAPANLTPPTSTVQQPAGRREEASGDDLTSVVLNSTKDRLSIITKHRRSREAIQETSSMAVDQVFNRALNELLAATEATHAEQLKVVEAKHYEALKEAEAKHTEAHKEAKAKHLEVLQVIEAKLASLEEELKKKEGSIAKITASKEQYKENSLINYWEAHKLQAKLEISRKEVAALEE